MRGDEVERAKTHSGTYAIDVLHSSFSVSSICNSFKEKHFHASSPYSMNMADLWW
jgi:hypothetical protein